MSFALLFNYLMLNMFSMLIHPFSGACDLFVDLFRGLYCSGSMCVAVTLWFGWGGVVSRCGLKHQCTSASARIRIPHHHSQTTTYHQHTSNQSNTTHEIMQQISRKLLRMEVLTSETEALVPQPAYGYHTSPTKPQCNTNTHRTRAIQPMK